MITLPSRGRFQVVIARGVRGLPAAGLAGGIGDGTCYDATSGDAIPCPDYGGGSSSPDLPYLQDSTPLYPGSPTATPAGANPVNWAAVINAAGTATSNAIRASQAPYYLPGSNTLYNPATGQLTNQVGVTATSATPLLIGALVVGAILIFALKK
jgi:hypothetical protein